MTFTLRFSIKSKCARKETKWGRVVFDDYGASQQESHSIQNLKQCNFLWLLTSTQCLIFPII